MHAGGDVERLLIPIMQDLWVLMAELATDPTTQPVGNRNGRPSGQEMIIHLEAQIDELDERFDPPTEFVVPGGDVTAAWLDLARTVVRRAERHALAAAPPPSLVVTYLNRLSDLLWTMARWQDAADGSNTAGCATSVVAGTLQRVAPTIAVSPRLHRSMPNR